MSRFFIDRPIVAMVAAIFFVIAGAVMVLRLPIAQFPDIVPPQIQTTATYPGADALTMEQSVATPIEEQVNGAKNMIYMQSINGNDGTTTLQVSFAVGTNVDLDQVQVQNRLSQATSSLPVAVNNYGLVTQQTVGIPLLVIAITSPHGTWSQNFLANYVAINIQDELARIPGIGQVKIFGAGNYAMRVWVTPDKLAKLQLTVADLVNALSAQNVVNPAGTIGGEPAPPASNTPTPCVRRGAYWTPSNSAMSSCAPILTVPSCGSRMSRESNSAPRTTPSNRLSTANRPRFCCCIRTPVPTRSRPPIRRRRV